MGALEILFIIVVIITSYKTIHFHYLYLYCVVLINANTPLYLLSYENAMMWLAC